VASPAPVPYVAVVDDDLSVRRALARLLTEMSFDVRTFGSAEEFMEALPSGAPACVVLDAHLPATSGLDLHGRLRREGHRAGVVFITADDELASSQAMRGTGAPCLTKPVDKDALLTAIHLVLGTGA
jgi:FixJ family two-component response regulator